MSAMEKKRLQKLRKKKWRKRCQQWRIKTENN